MLSPLLACLSLATVPDFRVVLFDETDQWSADVVKEAGTIQAAYVFNFSKPHRVSSIIPSYDGFYVYSRASQKVDPDVQRQLVENSHPLVKVAKGVQLFNREQFGVGPDWESPEALARYYVEVESYSSLLDSVIRNERSFRRW